jgi:hypothetical protein
VNRRRARLAVGLLVVAAAACSTPAAEDGAVRTVATDAPPEWDVHSLERPKPPVVTPAPAQDPAAAPSDAIVLFDGRDITPWAHADGTPARWKVQDGYLEVLSGSGALETTRAFGDVQLHLEWMAPASAAGSGQDRGNSGVFLMGRYEIQVLDSYDNETYADGQAAAIYGQQPPMVNASRRPGEWQTYDIVFRAPRFGADGSVITPARATVLHNDVLVHDAVTFTGATAHQRRAEYEPHEDKLPLSLQDHGAPVRFRNIWIRELAETLP